MRRRISMHPPLRDPPLTRTHAPLVAGWQKRKKGKKTDKDRERDYAVKAAKKERTQSLIITAIKEAKPSSNKEALAIAEATEKTLLAEDMTGTLKPLTKPQLDGLAKKAMQALKEEL